MVYLASTPTKNTFSKKLLIGFLFLKLIPELGDFVYYFVELRILLANKTPYFFYAQEAFDFAWAPLLYFFVTSRGNQAVHFKQKHFLHGIPFVLMLAYSIQKVIGVTQKDIVDTICYRYLWETNEFLFFTTLQYLQFFIYWGLSYRIIIKNTLTIGSLSTSENQDKINWLKFLLSGLFMWRLILGIDFVLSWSFDLNNDFLIMMHILAEIIFLIFLMLFFLKGVHRPFVFMDYLQSRLKYATMPLAVSSKSKIMDDFTELMQKEKPYLNPELRLQQVALALKIPSHHLSQVINEIFGQNFQDLINGYRVGESMVLLSQFTNHEKTVSEIIYESGFNTKSVFNTAFKKHTGLTPSAYRLNYRRDIEKVA
jgi:AraC-like DNA-binding protein